MTVLVVGSINADLLVQLDELPRPGETLLAREGTTVPGGKGANQALAARMAGAQTILVGAVGPDALADMSLALLRRSGVDLAQVVTLDARTGLAVVMVDQRAENSIVVVPGANALFTPDELASAATCVREAPVVVVQGELPVATTNKVAELCTGQLIVNLAPVIDLDASVLRAANPLVVNEHEAAGALRILTGQDVSDPDSDAAEGALLQQLLHAGVESIVMTLGSRGCLLGTADRFEAISAPVVDAVDTVGAGDAFVGALAAQLADGVDLSAAARFAVNYSAATVLRSGAQSSYPEASQVAGLLASDQG